MFSSQESVGFGVSLYRKTKFKNLEKTNIEFAKWNPFFKLNDDFTNNSTKNHQSTDKFMNGVERAKGSL